MEAKIIMKMEKCHLAPKAFVYITYGTVEHDIYITFVKDNRIEFITDTNLKMKKGDIFFIGKSNDKKLKMEVTKTR